MGRFLVFVVGHASLVLALSIGPAWGAGKPSESAGMSSRMTNEIIDTIEDFEAQKDAKCFATADHTKGYWQFLLDEMSKKLTAFVCPVGAFEHNRVPMGLKTAAAYYQRSLQRVLEPLLYVHLLQYIDDTLLYAEGEDEEEEQDLSRAEAVSVDGRL